MTNSSILRRLAVCLAVVLLPAISQRTADAQEKQTKQKQTKEKKDVVVGYEFQAHDVSYFTDVFSVNLSSPIGATLVSVGDTLRSQLSLPADRGAVVTHVRKKGPADNAGLKLDDIVLAAGDKPIRKAADLNAIVKAAAGKKVKLELIRDGKPASVVISIPRPDIYRVKLRTYKDSLAFAYQGGGHYIGVNIVPVDRTLRSHLKLAKDQGVVVTDVVKDSPAAKAGFLKHDVLLSAGKKPLGKLDDLRKVVTASAGKSLSIKLLRSGKRQTLNVTPEKRPAGVVQQEDHLIKIWDLDDDGFYDFTIVGHPAVGTQPKQLTSSKAGVEGKLNRMIKQIEQLQKSLQELRKSLPNKPANSPGDPFQKK